jgi:hypothetical protein
MTPEREAIELRTIENCLKMAIPNLSVSLTAQQGLRAIAILRTQLSAAQAELAATKTELAHVVQVSGVLCEKCGWAMKFPDEPCRCELEAELAAMRGGKVVIPEPDHLALWDVFRDDHGGDLTRWQFDLVMRHVIAWTRDHAVAAVPEGKVLVDAGELEALRGFAWFVAYPEEGTQFAPRAAYFHHVAAKTKDEREIASALVKRFKLRDALKPSQCPGQGSEAGGGAG